MPEAWRQKLLDAGGDSAARKALREESVVCDGILKGLGWKASELPALCDAVGLEYDAMDSRSDTALRILAEVSSGLVGGHGCWRDIRVEVRGVPRRKSFWAGPEAAELADLARSAGSGLLLLCRMEGEGGGRACMGAVAFLRDGGLRPPDWVLRPGTTVRAIMDGDEKSRVTVWSTRDGAGMVSAMARELGWAVPERDR